MSASAVSIDHLPYIDTTHTPHSLAAAKSLIQAELAETDTTNPHNSLPVTHEPRYSLLVDAEHNLISQGKPREKAIDVTRYEEPSAPTDPSDKNAWHAALQQAYKSSEYLEGRLQNLGLLETYGKNAWLIGNSQLEDILRDLERDVAAAKTGLETVQRERRDQQSAAQGEMQSLEEAWRVGVGRHIEVEAANERLRLEILERKRQAAA